jgi:SAM-dependent methyltransferase
MAQWDHGYVTDIAYTSNFYREITPAWLSMTSLLLGHRPPDLAAPFHYADFGCGNGFTALIVAATCQHAEVWGFDFNPAHIEFATRLATQSGLANVHFFETSFADLAALPDAALPQFDFAVSHGVLSWISHANRHHLLSAITHRLKPGGLVYLGYNVTTGWTSMVPVQALMQMLTAASPERTDLAIPAMLDFIDRLKQAGALFFQTNPSLEARLQEIRKQDHRYIAHEFLNRDWHPLMFTDIAGELAEGKCRYIGSASLAENIDSISVPADVAPILAEVRDPFLRETLRDIGSNQAFRRDLYRKGLTPLPAAEQQGLLETLTLVGLGQPVPEGGATFATPIGSVTGRPEVYQPLVEMLEAGPLSVQKVREAPVFAGRPLVELMQAFTLLVSGSYAHPLLPDDGMPAGRDASRRLNQVIAQANANAGDLPRLAAPTIGSSIGADVLETLVVGRLLAGRPAEVDPVVADILPMLARSGRNVQRDGKAVNDPVEARQMISDAVRGIIERRLPVLRRLGVID